MPQRAFSRLKTSWGSHCHWHCRWYCCQFMRPSVLKLKLTQTTSTPNNLEASTFQTSTKLCCFLSIGHNLMMMKEPSSRPLQLGVG
jgi:hypothetical protein